MGPGVFPIGSMLAFTEHRLVRGEECLSSMIARIAHRSQFTNGFQSSVISRQSLRPGDRRCLAPIPYTWGRRVPEVGQDSCPRPAHVAGLQRGRSLSGPKAGQPPAVAAAKDAGPPYSSR